MTLPRNLARETAAEAIIALESPGFDMLQLTQYTVEHPYWRRQYLPSCIVLITVAD